MRSFICVFAVLTAALAGTSRSEARAWYPWCATYADTSGITECGFSTFQQCLATISGIGGSCGSNPFPPPGADRRTRHKRVQY
jgi:hypothetical protein